MNTIFIIISIIFIFVVPAVMLVHVDNKIKLANEDADKAYLAEKHKAAAIRRAEKKFS